MGVEIERKFLVRNDAWYALAAEDEALDLPDWIGEEVSHDPRYYNVNLVQHPYTSW